MHQRQQLRQAYSRPAAIRDIAPGGLPRGSTSDRLPTITSGRRGRAFLHVKRRFRGKGGGLHAGGAYHREARRGPQLVGLRSQVLACVQTRFSPGSVPRLSKRVRHSSVITDGPRKASPGSTAGARGSAHPLARTIHHQEQAAAQLKARRPIPLLNACSGGARAHDAPDKTREPFQRSAAYSASKNGIIGITRSMALALGLFGTMKLSLNGSMSRIARRRLGDGINVMSAWT